MNDSESSLPPGAVATYELQGSSGKLEFVGDDRIGALPMDQRRLFGFASDLNVCVDYEDQLAQTITGATVDRGGWWFVGLKGGQPSIELREIRTNRVR